MFSMKTWCTLLIVVFVINFDYSDGLVKSLEERAREELAHFDQELSRIYNDPAEIKANLTKTLNRLWTTMNGYAVHYPDETLTRQIKKIVGSQFYLQPDQREQISQIQKNLSELAIKPDNCQFGDRNICTLAYVPQIKSVFGRSQNPKELEYYWREWRDKHSQSAATNYENFIYVLQKPQPAVSRLPVPFHGWYSRFDEPNFITEMENIMIELAPFYKQFHAYVSYVLKQKYPEATFRVGEPIPQSLLEQILEQAWDENSILQAPYPNKKLPNLKAGLKGHAYDAEKIAKISAQFFNSIGFTPFNESFWNSLVTQKTPQEAGEDCNPEFDPITKKIKYCPKSTFKQFLQLHGYIAQAEYKILAENQPLGLRDEACPGFSNAIGEAVILSASTPKHIERVDILTDYHYDNELSLNRLFRLGIHTMFQIPSYYVHDRFIIDTLNDMFDWSKINCHYWSLMNQYAGVDPPINRNRTAMDMPYKFYEHIADNHQTKKFISEVVGYQIYRGLCIKSGQYVPNDPLRPLQNCDFYDSIAVGNILKEAMALGQSKPWKVILQNITGDATINAYALLDFYKPLYEWLVVQNKKNNVYVGWTRSTKCY